LISETKLASQREAWIFAEKRKDDFSILKSKRQIVFLKPESNIQGKSTCFYRTHVLQIIS